MWVYVVFKRIAGQGYQVDDVFAKKENAIKHWQQTKDSWIEEHYIFLTDN